jgi:ABC-type multidrug transport system ATPase subunit
MNEPATVDAVPAIALLGLTKRFGRTLAVDNLSLEIPEWH